MQTLGGGSDCPTSAVAIGTLVERMARDFVDKIAGAVENLNAVEPGFDRIAYS
jgi:hypothetical protein